MTVAIADVRSALQTAIATTGIRTYAYIQDVLNVPCAHVAASEFDPRLVMGTTKAVYPFTIHVYVSRAATVEQNQKLLDTYRDVTGTASIALAVKTSSAWTATVDYADVTRVGEVQAVEYGGAPYLTFEIDVEVCW